MEKPRLNKFFAARPLADLLKGTLDPLLARRGFSQSDLIFYWDEIAGQRLAEHSQPIKLAWPARVSRDENALATLFLRIEPGFALEFQHLCPVIIDRVNAHLGWRCIGKLTLKQGPLEKLASCRSPRPRPDSRAQSHASRYVAEIENEALRAALARLGAWVLSKGNET